MVEPSEDVHGIHHSPCTVGTTYVGRWYVPDKPKRWRGHYSWCKVYSGYLWFNTWTTEWMIVIQIAQRIKRMHSWNIGKEYGVVLVFFGCLAACTHGDLLTEQEGLQNKLVQRLLKLNDYIYRSLRKYLYYLATSIFSVYWTIIVMNVCIQ